MKKWTRILYQPCIPLGKDGRTITASEKHISLSRNVAKEGMVLLKNESELLPLKKGSKIALFGKGTFDYVKGGGGSGDVTVSYVTNLYDGFKRLGDTVSVEEKTAEYYRYYVKSQYESGGIPGLIAEPELPSELLDAARKYTDTAVISVSRFSGEGWDRSVKDHKAPEDRGYAMQSAKLFENGDFYLSNAEKRMVEQVKETFPRVIVVLNVGGMVDTAWFRWDERIQSVLIAWQGGMEGGAAAAELLCGIGNPCGHLSDTFANRLEDYPGTDRFHESENYVDYTEDVYVGYRYFETLPQAKDRVCYPFGFGLSYTTFELGEPIVSEADGDIHVSVDVTNTGSMPGKEVVQVYASAPQGMLGKPARVLTAYQKTRLLATGETQRVVLTFPVSRMASYDDTGKIAKAAWVLEKGDYIFHIGTSVRSTKESIFRYNVKKNSVTEQLSPRMVPTSLKKRMLADGEYEELPLGEPNDPDETALDPMNNVSRFGGEWPAVRAVERNARRSNDRAQTLDFNLVAEGKLSLDDFIDSLTDEEAAHLLGGQPNTGVANTWGFGNLPQYHVPNAMTADGPAGLRIHPDCCVRTTAFPCATLLACTWDPTLTFAVGEAGATEVKENNIAMWLTPAINIHRSPLCGRNFEYYSEDPYLTGTMATGMVKGIQSQHIAPAVKHFALNDKETNRKDSDSRASERAIREIYLKAFEIVVKEAQPWCIMSSYNIINGHRASENRDMLTGILRDEWGYDGMVCTDWWTYGEHYKEVKAGNDLKMATGYPERLLNALQKGVLTREEMNVCIRRILNTLLKFD